jgi:hypothetical protein
MPDYCQVRLSHSQTPELQAARRSWSERMGPIWGDVHHYCEGLKFVRRAGRPGISPLDRSYNLTASLPEFDYVLNSKNATPDHWLMREIHMQKALVYGRLGRHAEAAAEYQKMRPVK